jgi:L-asparaginase II
MGCQFKRLKLLFLQTNTKLSIDDFFSILVLTDVKVINESIGGRVNSDFQIPELGLKEDTGKDNASHPDTLRVIESRNLLSSESTKSESVKSGHIDSAVENSHTGWLVIVNTAQQVLYATQGATSISTFFRSAAKPFQAMALVEKGLHRQLTQQELAIICASHSGTPEHCRIVEQVLKKAMAEVSQLQCGSHLPVDHDSARQLTLQGQPPNALHHNCSGKHAGMLLYCQHTNIYKERYLSPDSLLQKNILLLMQRFAEMETISVGTDGCGAPVFYLPLERMAFLYARLSIEDCFYPIRQAILTYPALVGGAGRIDTAIMQASQGRLLSKVGADGVICVCKVNGGEGFALKMADGNNRMRELAVLQALFKMGWLSKESRESPLLKPFLDYQNRMNNQGKVIGQISISFPEP